MTLARSMLMNALMRLASCNGDATSINVAAVATFVEPMSITWCCTSRKLSVEHCTQRSRADDL